MNLKNTTLNEINQCYRLNGCVCPHTPHNSYVEIPSVITLGGGDLGGDWVMRAEAS